MVGVHFRIPSSWWRRLSGDRTVVNFTMWSWVGLNVFMLIWRECLVLGDVRPVSTAASEHGVGWGGGGMGWAYNVHVGCRKDVMLRHATVWRCWSNFRDALDATVWRCWSNFRDALDATLWRCWSNFRDALDTTLWRCWNNFRDKIGLGLDLLQELGKLMKSINKKIGYWKWADRRCKKAFECVSGICFRNPFFPKIAFSLQRKRHEVNFEARLQCFWTIFLTSIEQGSWIKSCVLQGIALWTSKTTSEKTWKSAVAPQAPPPFCSWIMISPNIVGSNIIPYNRHQLGFLKLFKWFIHMYIYIYIDYRYISAVPYNGE